MARRVVEIHHLNVDEGDCTVIAVRDHRDGKWHTVANALIDAGTRGDERIAKYMESMGLLVSDGTNHTIQYVIASHYHDDHHSGFQCVENSKYTISHLIDVGGYNIKRKLENNPLVPQGKKTPAVLPIYQKWWDWGWTFPGFFDKKCRSGTPVAGIEQPRIVLTDDVVLRCYAGNKLVWIPDAIGSTAGKIKRIPLSKSQNSNPNSISMAFLLEYGSFSYFTAGDILGDLATEVAEAVSAHRGPAAPGVTIVKANHHGSIENNPKKFYELLKPNLVAVTAASRWSLPKQEGITRLRGDGSPGRRILFANVFNCQSTAEDTQYFKERTNLACHGDTNWGIGGEIWSVAVVVGDDAELVKKAYEREQLGKEKPGMARFEDNIGEKTMIAGNIPGDTTTFKSAFVPSFLPTPAETFETRDAMLDLVPADQHALAERVFMDYSPQHKINKSEFPFIEKTMLDQFREKITENFDLKLLNLIYGVADKHDIMIDEKDAYITTLLAKRTTDKSTPKFLVKKYRKIEIDGTEDMVDSLFKAERKGKRKKIFNLDKIKEARRNRDVLKAFNMEIDPQIPNKTRDYLLKRKHE